MRRRICSSSSRISTRTAPRSISALALAAKMWGSDMAELLVSVSDGRVAAAEQAVQFRHQLLDARVFDAIPKGLAVAPEGHDVFVAHSGEMLRQRRLAEADRIDQGANRHLAGLDQLAQNHQPAPR